jgi:DNA repair photolyase
VDAPEGITREAIKIILKSGNRVNILTKSEWSCLDFDLLASVPGNKFGMTLTFIDPGLSIVWEPAATLPEYRIKTLAAAKYVGIETWASIEPVIIPSESLSIMKAALPYVDEYKIGMWNHDPRAKDIDWRDFKIRAQGIMELHGKRYMFKRELLKKYREEPPWNLPTGANSMRHAQGSGPGPSTT